MNTYGVESLTADDVAFPQKCRRARGRRENESREVDGNTRAQRGIVFATRSSVFVNSSLRANGKIHLGSLARDLPICPRNCTNILHDRDNYSRSGIVVGVAESFHSRRASPSTLIRSATIRAGECSVASRRASRLIGGELDNAPRTPAEIRHRAESSIFREARENVFTVGNAGTERYRRSAINYEIRRENVTRKRVRGTASLPSPRQSRGIRKSDVFEPRRRFANVIVWAHKGHPRAFRGDNNRRFARLSFSLHLTCCARARARMCVCILCVYVRTHWSGKSAYRGHSPF